MEFLRFILSSIWVWLGFVILAALAAEWTVALVRECKRNRRVKAYRVDQRWCIEIENATKRDVDHVVFGPCITRTDDLDEEETGETVTLDGGRKEDGV